MKSPLIKSRERVEKFAEVYTPEWVVKDMCDQIPKSVWDDITASFFEPACGNGAFLTEILSRKLDKCTTVEQGIRALWSIYGIDIQGDNVIESRQRLFKQFCIKYPFCNDKYLALAKNILAHHIVQSDSLKCTNDDLAAWKAGGILPNYAEVK